MLPIAKGVLLTGMGLTILIPAAFLVTVAVLYKFAWPKAKEYVAEQRDQIRQTVVDAERARKEADDLRSEAEERLVVARQQADEIVVRAKQAAEVHAKEVESQAHAKADEMVEQARREIRTEERRTLERLRRGIADITVGAAEDVARVSLDDADHRELIDGALAEVDLARMAAGSQN